MSRALKFLIALPAFAWTFHAPHAVADTVITYPVTYSGHYQLGAITGTFTGSSIDLSNSDGSLLASASISPVPSLSVSGTGTNGAGDVGAIQMEFAFEICPLSGCGAPQSVYTNLGVNAYGKTNLVLGSASNASGEAQAQLQIVEAPNGAGGLINAFIPGPGTSPGTYSWTVDQTLSNIAVDTVYYVIMSAVASGDLGTSFSALVDPMFTVDPSL